MESVDTPASTAVDSCWDVKTEVTIKASADVSLDEGVTVIVDASSLEVSMTLVCISASLVVKVWIDVCSIFVVSSPISMILVGISATVVESGAIDDVDSIGEIIH